MGIINNLIFLKMNTKLIVLIVLLQTISYNPLFSQSDYWQKIQQKNMEVRSDWTGSFKDGKAQFYSLDLPYLLAVLENSPHEFDGKLSLRHVVGKELLTMRSAIGAFELAHH